MYPNTQQSWWLSWTSLAQWFKDRPQLFGQILSTDLAHCLPFLSHLRQFINKFLLYNPSLSDSQFNTWPSISSISKVTSSHLPKFIFPLSKSPRVLSHTNPQKPILNHLAHFHSFSVHGSSILTSYTPSTKPLLHLHILPIHKQFLKLKALGLLSPTLKNLLPHLSHTCKGSPATSVYTFFYRWQLLPVRWLYPMSPPLLVKIIVTVTLQPVKPPPHFHTSPHFYGLLSSTLPCYITQMIR